MSAQVWPALLATAAAFAARTGAAQGLPTIVVSGYESPVQHRLAPGQVVPLFASGLPVRERVVANRMPLPTELGGVSVQLIQQQLTSPISLPLLRVEPLQNGITAIVVQMPYEMIPGGYIGPITAGPAPIDTGELQITWQGSPGTRIRIIPVQDRVRLLRTCDSFPESLWEDPGARPRLCLPVVTHGDGTLVSADHPATSGEIVVVYAFGLGRPPEPPVTGGPVPFPVVMPLDKWGVNFSFGLNAGPRPPSATPDARPTFVGLVPGFAGLYQVNVRLPDRRSDSAQACTNQGDSNVTLTIWGATSNDSIGVCMR